MSCCCIATCFLPDGRIISLQHLWGRRPHKECNHDSLFHWCLLISHLALQSFLPHNPGVYWLDIRCNRTFAWKKWSGINILCSMCWQYSYLAFVLTDVLTKQTYCQVSCFNLPQYFSFLKKKCGKLSFGVEVNSLWIFAYTKEGEGGKQNHEKQLFLPVSVNQGRNTKWL